MVDDAQVIQDFLRHVETFVEQPHPAFGGMPVCPFARQVRLEKRIDFIVLEKLGDGEDRIMDGARRYLEQEHFEVLLVLYKDKELPCDVLYDYIAEINKKLIPMGLEGFGGHPQDDFQIQGLYTRRGPWPNFQIIKRSLAKKASQSLWSTGYYRNWTPEQLKKNGLPRED